MTLGEVEDDRAGLEQLDTSVLERRNLAERLEPQVRGLLRRLEPDRPDLVRLSDLFEGPADAGIAGEPLAAVG